MDFAGPRVCSLIAGALDATTCAHIVRAVTDSFEAAGKDYPPSYRDNDRAVVDDPGLARALFNRMRSALPARVVNRHGGTWRLVGLNERFRFCRYTGGQCFRVHRDGAHAPSSERRSLLTVQIYLDEGFEGGHTRFYASRHGELVGSIEARTGHAIVFDHDLWHDGEAVTRGTKHVLRTDVVFERERGIADEAREGVTALEGHTGYVFSLVAMGDGALMSGSRDRTVRRWARSEAGAWRCTHVLEGHTASVLGLAEPRPGIVWSGSRDRTVREWDLASGASHVVCKLGGAVLCLELLANEEVAAGAADATITNPRRRPHAPHARGAQRLGLVARLAGRRSARLRLGGRDDSNLGPRVGRAAGRVLTRARARACARPSRRRQPGRGLRRWPRHRLRRRSGARNPRANRGSRGP